MTTRATLRSLLAAGIILAAVVLAGRASAAELLMFEESGCPWCKRWHAEVGIGYPKSAEGQRAPLRPISLHGPHPKGIALASPVVVSPTFVLVDQGREVGRIIGYPGADFFWGLLGELMKKLDRPNRSMVPSSTFALVEPNR